MKARNNKRYSQEAQELVRFRVVDYLKAKKGTQKQCSQIFGLTPTGINKI